MQFPTGLISKIAEFSRKRFKIIQKSMYNRRKRMPFLSVCRIKGVRFMRGNEFLTSKIRFMTYIFILV